MLNDPDALNLDRELILSMIQQSMDALEWALPMIPEAWTHRSPSGTRMSPGEGAWSAAMNLAHMALGSEVLYQSVLRSLLGGGDGVSDSSLREPSPYEPAAMELAERPLQEIMKKFRAGRAEEAALARAFSPEAWLAPTTAAWGRSGYGPRLHSPARIVAKSFQHTWEHGNAILRVALFAPRELMAD